MDVEVLRLKDDGDTTIGVFLLDRVAFCGCVEDQGREGEKVMHETRIPEGTYKLSLRAEGGYDARYTKKFGKKFHKGMLCVYNKPNWVLENNGKKFQYILIHSGNTDDHTSGCLLPNFAVNFDTMVGSSSVNAYKMLYPILRDLILESKEGYISIKVTDGTKIPDK